MLTSGTFTSEAREDSDLSPSEAVSYSPCAVSCAHPEVGPSRSEAVPYISCAVSCAEFIHPVADLTPFEAVSYIPCAVSCAEVIHPVVCLRSSVFPLSEPLPYLEFETDLRTCNSHTRIHLRQWSLQLWGP